MGVVLVTGAAGYIGSRLVRRLASSQEVISFDVVALSRSKPVETVVSVLGSYASPADLEVLDEYEIDSVV
ncbi:NAD-dependent epimerase/dehydratase family protein, partial [Phytoactinopolyspora mesophila]|uniref:NAD-dependent epimerase/dehydratase family protein n=1 Tax=Phytoactinopolyspora mesophila TaxID=2650750 RepID=UPI0013920A7F